MSEVNALCAIHRFRKRFDQMTHQVKYLHAHHRRCRQCNRQCIICITKLHAVHCHRHDLNGLFARAGLLYRTATGSFARAQDDMDCFAELLLDCTTELLLDPSLELRMTFELLDFAELDEDFAELEDVASELEDATTLILPVTVFVSP